MHELLAPVLWVVQQDAVNVDNIVDSKRDEEGVDFMLQVLDSRYVEHDAFNLFCAIMQTAKTFYEIGESRDSSAIVAQSERIHKELLGAVDPDMSTHLEVIGIVPQIFAIRWLRLLFGREFEFKDVLKLWDALFAESLSIDIIDMACVAILLRLRWQLIDADYTAAITTLTKLNLPKEGDSARAIVRDAAELAKRKTIEAGADITQLRTGKRQYVNPLGEETVVRASTPQPRTHGRLRSSQASPSPSPARFATPQRHLESLFSNVSTNFQKNAEGWSVQNVSKALRGAVGEAKRNFEQLQGNHSRNSSIDVPRNLVTNDPFANTTNEDLADRLRKHEERNKALSKMLESAQETLRKWRSSSAQQNVPDEDVFNTALAKIQFVSVYLADSDIPIPERSPEIEKKSFEEPIVTQATESKASHPNNEVEGSKEQQQQPISKTTKETADANQLSVQTSTPGHSEKPRESSLSPTRPGPIRPSLAESSFSFMLGEDRHRTSFVRSKPLPEERRISDAQAAAEKRRNSVDTKSSTKEKKERKAGNKANNSEDDGFTMSTLL